MMRLSSTRIALAITLLGGLLRLYRYNTLGLWFDEGVSIYLARLPWSSILFNIDQFDTHPPGYPLALKFVTIFLPEVVAGRILSLVCGTLTIYILYELARRLLGTRPALVAAFVLAISPLHLWYSQENRPFAGAVLLVALSYLAVITYQTDQRPRWLILYATSTFAAALYDYSAIYALVPQTAIILIMLWQQRRKAIPLIAALAVAILAFLPWGIQMLGIVDNMTQERALTLGITPENVGSTTISITGVGGFERYFLGSEPAPWEAIPALRWLILIPLVLATILGILTLLGRVRTAPLTPIVGLGLFIGTLLMGIAVSLYKPGFAERTVLAASLGWCIILGAAIEPPAIKQLVPGVRRAIRIASIASVTALGALSIATLAAIYGGADRDHWRDMAADSTGFAKWGYPVLSYHVIVDTLLDVYAPHLRDTGYAYIDQGHDLPSLDNLGGFKSGALWLNYVEIGGIDRVRTQLEEQGYRRAVHLNYSQHSVNQIYTDLYIQTPDGPASSLLQMLPTHDPSAPNSGWELSPNVAWEDTAPTGASMLTAQSDGSSEQRAARRVEVDSPGLYGLTFETRSELTEGRVRSFLICANSEEKWPVIAPDPGGATTFNDGEWHMLNISAECPSGTTSLIFDVRNAGKGNVAFRNFSVYKVSPAP